MYRFASRYQCPPRRTITSESCLLRVLCASASSSPRGATNSPSIAPSTSTTSAGHATLRKTRQTETPAARSTTISELPARLPSPMSAPRNTMYGSISYIRRGVVRATYFRASPKP